MMRRKFVRAVNGYRTAFKYAQDLDLWIRMSRKYGPQFLYVLPERLLKYRISPEKFRRDQIKKIYADYAGEPEGKRKTLDEQITQSIEEIYVRDHHRRMQSMYQYTAGRLLLDREKRLQAGRRFLSAVAASPNNIRAWYGCGLFILPAPLRRQVTT
jgi:hypothetical protein